MAHAASDTTLPGSGVARRRVIRGLAGICAATLAAALLWYVTVYTRQPAPVRELSAGRADEISRRVGVAFNDTQRSWSGWFRSRGAGEHVPARLVLYTRTRPSPCAGALPATGPFYCPVDRTAAFDMVFLDSLEKRMQQQAGLGTALVVARVVAAQVQSGLGLPDAATGSADQDYSREHTLHGDCLAGAWAGMAADRLGSVPDGLYGTLVENARTVAGDLGNAGTAGGGSLDPFASGVSAEREQAFRTGQNAADPSACGMPASN